MWFGRSDNSFDAYCEALRVLRSMTVLGSRIHSMEELVVYDADTIL